MNRPKISPEIADVIALMEQRRDNAVRIANHVPEFEDISKQIGRHFDVLIDDLRNGLHEGAADVRRRLLANQGEPA